MDEPGQAKELFTDEERQALADALAAVTGTAELLGRSRVRIRERQAREHFESHAEGEACEPGETAAKTGCTPAAGEPSPGEHRPQEWQQLKNPSGQTAWQSQQTGRMVIQEKPPTHHQHRREDEWKGDATLQRPGESSREYVLRTLPQFKGERPPNELGTEAFHDPDRLRLEEQIAGVLSSKGGTELAFHDTDDASEADQSTHFFHKDAERLSLHPHPSEEGVFVLESADGKRFSVTPDMPPDQVEYAIRKAAGVKIPAELKAKYAKHAEVGAFSALPTAWEAFDEGDGPLRPFHPAKALQHFLGKVPTLSVNVKTWPEEKRRKAFHLAVATEQELLERVQGAIARALETGEIRRGQRDVEKLLDQAGVTPRNPTYPELVMRTSMMDAYNSGGDEERVAVQDSFPVWQWSGIRDGRQRPSHEVHFDRYFSADVPFHKVRDSVAGEFDGYNCRCTAIEVYKDDWAELVKAGARVSEI